MKNKLMVIAIVFANIFGQINSAFQDDRLDRKHAHVLVKYMYADKVRESFEDGQFGKDRRAKLREEILDECPIAFRDASKRSFAQLLVWREKRFLQGDQL